MGHQIRMPPQAEKWVAGVLGKIGFRVALPGLNAAYRQQLVALSRVRRAAADVATSRKRLELQIGALERQAAEQGNPGSKDSGGDAADQGHTARDGTGQLADLRRQYAEMQAKEERITAASRRLMAEVNAFRAGTEATKAAYITAEKAAEAVWAEIQMNRNPGSRR
jgi:phage shock protein A